MKRPLLALLLLGCSMSLQAEDTQRTLVDGVYYTFNTTNMTATVAAVPSGETAYSGDITIPATVTHGRFTLDVVAVEPKCFSNAKIQSITFQTDGDKGVTEIGENAFAYCRKLETVQLPATLNKLGYSAFYECSALQSVNIPDGVKTIERLTFSNCTSLSNIELPSVMEEEGICQSAFYGAGLTSITIPMGVKMVGKEAFSHCKRLREVIFPDDYTILSVLMFSDCESLEEITLPPSLTAINSEAFYCCPLKKVSIPSSVWFLIWDAFYGCDEMEELIIEDSSRSVNCSGSYIDDDYFPKLKRIYLGCDITNIDEFYDLPKLETLEIGPNVTNLEYNFSNNLKEIISHVANPAKLKESFSNTVKANAHLKVPKGSYDAYCNTSGWSGFFFIEEYETDGIRTLPHDVSTDSNHFYTISGQPVDVPLRKGIYIRDSKKILIK